MEVVGIMGVQAAISGDTNPPKGAYFCNKSGGEPLEVDRRGRQVGLNLQVLAVNAVVD